MQKHHTLYEVLQSVQRMFERYWQKPVWIRTEIAKLNFYPHSGHAYPLLVEKKESKSVAEIRSTIWSSTLNVLKRKFESTTKREFSDGIEVLILCELKFSPGHGLTLNIIDIDPNFTLGKMELERLNCIKKLKSEQIFDKNKRISIPLIPKRVAVISVETSKGYKDFLETLAQYKRFHFDLELFPALLQGDKAVESIMNQLKAINERKDEFDLVAIIRGGGGEVGLSCYDNYFLSKEVATFSLPVISGIGICNPFAIRRPVVASRNSIYFFLHKGNFT